MKSFRILINSILIYGVLAVSCTKDTPAPFGVEKSSIYFPLEIGHTDFYQVREIIYSDHGQKIDTLDYYLQEATVDKYTDDNGVERSIVDRFKRSTSDESWDYISSQSKYMSNNEAIVIEGSLPFIKLQLPVKQNFAWNGNQYFDDQISIPLAGESIAYYKNWQSKYLELDELIEINGKSFTNALIIQLADHENKLERRYGREIYVPDIGLVYRELIILDTQCFDACSSQNWEQKAEKGHIIRQSYHHSN